MILRPATFDDCEFIAAAYNSAWPESKKGRVFPVDVRNWINRYKKTSNSEFGLVGEVDEPVGFLLCSENPPMIHEIVVPVEKQGMGYASAMWRELQKLFVSKGITEAEFEALPGLIADLTTNGRFEKTGEGVGEHTGLPVIKGRVTADMQV